MGDTFDDEVEPSITINEYLDKLEEEELEADLVLGGDEGKECTYGMGYMKRQAIFSCLSCTPDGNAGVCTACSLSCHDGHEIVELWTKRNFRCDCGNSKFGEFVCKLCSEKDSENAVNSYNHNFKGLYCTCSRPYPDPDREDQEEMIQCVLCEDWFHEEHLGLEAPNEVPRDEEGEPYYEDFICKTCSDVCSFMRLYPKKIWAISGQTTDSPADTHKNKGIMEPVLSSDENNMTDNNGDMGNESKSLPNMHVGESSGPKEEIQEFVTCIMSVDPEDSTSVPFNKPLFLSKGWRDLLCRCNKCMDMYKNKGISYLLIKEDSIVEYEKMAKKRREEKLQQQEGAELKFLDKLGHVGKLEVLNGIADFKDELRSFLDTFDTSKSITPSDVHKIFENLAKKRQRLQ